MRQDTIIRRLNDGVENFVCILKGRTTGKAYNVGKSVKIPMTYGGKYGNNQKFNLFIPASHLDKNEKTLVTITNKLIYYYGIPEKNEYGYKMDLYSITHQIAVIS